MDLRCLSYCVQISLDLSVMVRSIRTNVICHSLKCLPTGFRSYHWTCTKPKYSRYVKIAVQSWMVKQIQKFIGRVPSRAVYHVNFYYPGCWIETYDELGSISLFACIRR